MCFLLNLGLVSDYYAENLAAHRKYRKQIVYRYYFTKFRLISSTKRGKLTPKIFGVVKFHKILLE